MTEVILLSFALLVCSIVSSFSMSDRKCDLPRKREPRVK